MTSPVSEQMLTRYWMETEGPCGSRVDSDESSVQVVLASEADARISALESELSATRAEAGRLETALRECATDAVSEALACSDYYLVTASNRQESEQRSSEIKQYAATLRMLKAKLFSMSGAQT